MARRFCVCCIPIPICWLALMLASGAQGRTLGNLLTFFRSSSAPQVSQGGTTRCMCIVSFEDSLWSLNENRPMPHAKAAVRHCTDTRYYIDGLGIATTNSSTDFIKDALRKVDSEVFTDQLLSSAALQTDIFGVKTLAYTRIMNYFNASGTCAMVFDTASRRYVEAKAAGAGSFQTVGKDGFTPQDVDQAEDNLDDDSCMCYSAPSAKEIRLAAKAERAVRSEPFYEV